MTTTHPLAEDYLRRLNHIARVLPRHERDELVAEIRNHLDSGLPPDATDADVRNLLDQLGPPNDIVAAARPEHPPMRRGPREVFALILLVTGFRRSSGGSPASVCCCGRRCGRRARSCSQSWYGREATASCSASGRR